MNHGLSLNDFYVYNGTKLGNIHAHPMVTRDELMSFLVQYNRRLASRYLPGALLSHDHIDGDILEPPVDSVCRHRRGSPVSMETT